MCPAAVSQMSDILMISITWVMGIGQGTDYFYVRKSGATQKAMNPIIN
jgi:hypothetical protein